MSTVRYEAGTAPYRTLGQYVSTVLCLANFSDYPEWVGKDRFGALPAKVRDLVQDCDIELHESGIELRAQQFVWLRYLKCDDARDHCVVSVNIL